jgi:hypothetical protein
MKIYSFTGLSLILASTLTVLAQSQLAVFSKPMPSPQSKTPPKSANYSPKPSPQVTPYSPPEATYVGRGKPETKVEDRTRRRDAESSTGLNRKVGGGAKFGVVEVGAEGTASKNDTSNTQECKSESVKVSTTPAMYRAPDGHIFKMTQKKAEEIITSNPWTACPNK